MLIPIAGGILNLVWYGIADLLRGHFLVAIVKGIFHFFITLIISVILSFLGLPLSHPFGMILVLYQLELMD